MHRLPDYGMVVQSMGLIFSKSYFYKGLTCITVCIPIIALCLFFCWDIPLWNVSDITADDTKKSFHIFIRIFVFQPFHMNPNSYNHLRIKSYGNDSITVSISFKLGHFHGYMDRTIKDEVMLPTVTGHSSRKDVYNHILKISNF